MFAFWLLPQDGENWEEHHSHPYNENQLSNPWLFRTYYGTEVTEQTGPKSVCARKKKKQTHLKLMQWDTGKKISLRTHDLWVKAEYRLAGQFLRSQKLGKFASLCNISMKATRWSLKWSERALRSTNGGTELGRGAAAMWEGQEIPCRSSPSISTKELKP